MAEQEDDGRTPLSDPDNVSMRLVDADEDEGDEDEEGEEDS